MFNEQNLESAIDQFDLIKNLQSANLIIDVRAPVEFAEGHIPGAINLPILDDEERAQVGTCYRHEGREAAIRLGRELVRGDNLRAKQDQWLSVIFQNQQSNALSIPVSSPVVHCYRGGLRSQFTAEFIHEARADVPIRVLPGGYKRVRAQVLEIIANCARTQKIFALTGMTGSGKTKVIQSLLRQRSALPSLRALDLEELAHHRGSAFGNRGPQPAQAMFENALAWELVKFLNDEAEDLPILVEDESRMIGKITLPECIFFNFRSNPVVLLLEDLQTRVANIRKDYVENLYKENSDDPDQVLEKLSSSLLAIAKRLGSERYVRLLAYMQEAHKLSLADSQDFSAHDLWIIPLLQEYYDPFYQRSFAKRASPVMFKGNAIEIQQYLRKIYLR